MKTPLADAVNKHLNHISFHTPAHCGGISRYDITELPYSGNLFSRDGVIAESEKEVSAVYAADKTLFVTSGATTALHAAIAAFAGKTFIVFGGAHKAVFSGLRQFAGDAYYLNDWEGLGAALSDIKPDAVIVTSPDYFGNTQPLQAIRTLCDGCGTALIIDAAHGSHFAFCGKFPVSAAEYGDLVIHSLHKTLPVMTGGALLHCKARYYDRAMYTLSELHTSSPSYPVMLGIESAVALMSVEGGTLWSGVIDGVKRFCLSLAPPFTVCKNDDPTRLVVESPYDGGEVSLMLNKAGIYPEMSFGNKVVFIVNPYNADKLPELAKAYSRIEGLTPCVNAPQPTMYKEPVKLLLKANYERVPLKYAAGRTLYKEVGYYPPGVPLYLPGHLLSVEDCNFISINANRVFGLDNGDVFVV